MQLFCTHCVRFNSHLHPFYYSFCTHSKSSSSPQSAPLLLMCFNIIVVITRPGIDCQLDDWLLVLHLHFFCPQPALNWPINRVVCVQLRSEEEIKEQKLSLCRTHFSSFGQSPTSYTYPSQAHLHPLLLRLGPKNGFNSGLWVSIKFRWKMKLMGECPQFEGVPYGLYLCCVPRNSILCSTTSEEIKFTR